MTGFYKKYNTDLLNVLISSTRKIKISKEITKKGGFLNGEREQDVTSNN